MDENLQNIEELFRDELQNLEVKPAKTAWDSIDNSLDKQRIIAITKKYRLYKSSAMILLLLLVIVSCYILIYKTDNSLKYSYRPTYIHSLENREIHTHSQAEINFPETSNTKPLKLTPKLIATGSQHTKHKNIFFPERSISKDSINQSNSSHTTHQATIIFQNPRQSKNHQSRVNYKIINGTLDSVIKLQDQFTINTIRIGNLTRNNSTVWPAILNIVSDIKPLHSLVFNGEATLNLKKQTISQFSFVPFISIDKSWYYLQKDLPDNQPDNYDQIQKSEKHDLSITAGLWLNFNIKKHWTLQTGLSYSRTNITVDPKEIYAQNDNQGKIKYRINTSTGYGFVLPSFNINPVLGDSIYSFTSNHTLEYLTLPFAVQYNISKNKIEFFINGGLAIHFLTKTSIETTLEKGFYNESEIVNKLQGVKKLYFGGLIGAGVAYKINSRFALTYFPTFHFALNSINNNTPVRSYPYSIGQSIGIKLTL